MLSYFNQFQSITNTQGFSKSFETPQNLETKQQHKYSRTNCGRSGRFHSPHQVGQRDTDRIPQKTNSAQSGPFIDYKGPCPVHPMSSHTWGDCHNNPKNKAMGGQHNNTQSNAHHYKGGNFYASRGCRRGQGHGHFNNNYPCLTNTFPTLYIKQTPESTSPEALSTVTNTDNSNTSNKQTYVLKHFKNQPNRGENNSQELNSNVVNCESVYLDEILCCESAAEATHISNLAMPCINLYTHHFNLLTLQHSQDEISNEHILDKNNNAFVFNMECIQEVDNFIINIDMQTNQTEC